MSGTSVLAVLRGLHLAAMLSMLGTQAFIAWVLPASATRDDRLLGRLIRLWRASGIVAVLAGAGWLVMEAGAIAGAETWSDLLNALPVVAGQTRFGQVVSVRLGLLLLGTLLSIISQDAVAAGEKDDAFSTAPKQASVAQATYACLAGRARWRVRGALLLTGAAAALQGVIGHAGATGGTTGDELLVSEALHLLAAGLWLGALLPLWLSVRALPLASAGAVCERFSPIGLGCVLVLAGTGAAQGLELIGTVPALLGTAYGHIALLKIALFLVALVLAAVNRLRLTDHVADGVALGRQHLLISLGLETAIGLAIIVAAAFLASNVPGVHEQPVWPLPFRFSLATVNEDADLRREVIDSLGLIAVSVLLLVAALALRRGRLAALALLAGVVAWRGPSLSLLTAEAYPTSFQTSPTGFSAASILHGQALYARNCAGCHGATGAGNGPGAVGLRIHPADLTQPHVFAHSDGEMYWWLSHGIEDPEGGLAMPGFGGTLSSTDIWSLIDYVRAHADGVALRRDGAFAGPPRAPAMGIACADPERTSMADLAGSIVHVVTSGTAPEAAPPRVNSVTLVLAPDEPPVPPEGACVGADAAAWGAYAVLAGVAPDRLAGMQFLIDPSGWLRKAGEWASADALATAEATILADPVRRAQEGGHEHHH